MQVKNRPQERYTVAVILGLLAQMHTFSIGQTEPDGKLGHGHKKPRIKSSPIKQWLRLLRKKVNPILGEEVVQDSDIFPNKESYIRPPARGKTKEDLARKQNAQERKTDWEK
jgi:hypothetical protein